MTYSSVERYWRRRVKGRLASSSQNCLPSSFCCCTALAPGKVDHQTEHTHTQRDVGRTCRRGAAFFCHRPLWKLTLSSSRTIACLHSVSEADLDGRSMLSRGEVRRHSFQVLVWWIEGERARCQCRCCEQARRCVVFWFWWMVWILWKESVRSGAGSPDYFRGCCCCCEWTGVGHGRGVPWPSMYCFSAL